MADDTPTVAGHGRPADADWGATTFGDRSTWSTELANVADLVFQTSFASALFWGPELRMLYNDAYVEMIADKHPAAVGARAQDVFPEAWETIGPLFDQAQTGTVVTLEDALVPLERRGFLEDCWFTFCYSPVRDRDERVLGVLDIAVETTRQVIDRRRLALLTRLAEQLSELEHVDELSDHATAVLGEDPGDFPSARVALSADRAVAHIEADRLPEAGELSVGEVDGDRVVVLGLGLAASEEPLGVLVARLSPGLAVDDDYLDFVRLIGATITQAADRVSTREADRALSETLQRSLLGRPMDLPGLDVAARYLPAADRAFVGGDWYDAYPCVERGTVVLCIGDVAGHDRQAAAVMAQARNLLRGVVLALEGSPAAALERLDRAMDAVQVDDIATAVLAEVDGEVAEDGTRRLRWSNAGHPPPVVVRADGHAELLARQPDSLLGAGMQEAREDHEIALRPGDRVVLYTDGLVERRSESLSSGLEWLRGTLESTSGLSTAGTCELLLDRIGDDVEDDVALLVFRVS